MAENIVKISSSEESFGSLIDALNAIQSGDTITLLSDIILEEVVTFTKRCSVDLNGKQITVKVPKAITVKNGAKVEFNHGSIRAIEGDKVEDCVVSQGANTTVSLNKVKLSAPCTVIHAFKKGSVKLVDSNVYADSVQPTVLVDGESSTLELNSGMILSESRNALVVENGAAATLLGGQVSTECDSDKPMSMFSAIRVLGNASKLVVDGCEIYSQHTRAIEVDDFGKVEIHSGRVHSTSKRTSAIAVLGDRSSLEIHDGKISSLHGSTISCSNSSESEMNFCSVSGGSFEAAEDIVFVASGTRSDVNISGGRFKGRLTDDTVQSGYIISDIVEDGFVKVIEKTWSDESAEKNLEEEFNGPDHILNPKEPPCDPDKDDPILNPELDPPVRPVPPLPPPQKNKVIKNSSVNLTRKTRVYNSPGRKHIIAEVVGAITIVSGDYKAPSGEMFALVKFRVPGAGRLATGYASITDISEP